MQKPFSTELLQWDSEVKSKERELHKETQWMGFGFSSIKSLFRGSSLNQC